ncbi:aminoglycoside phosphotransferase family protein [Actinokineospora sp. 24-640]
MTPGADELDWAATTAGTPVAGVRSLRAGGSPWLLDLGADTAVLLTGRKPAELRTQAAALLACAERGVPAPRLLGADAERGLLLTTTLPGGSHLGGPAAPARLRALGSAATLLAAMPLEPTPDLPRRHRPIELDEFAELSPMQERAAAALAEHPEPSGPTVLVHGDLWTGNTMWDGDTLTGFIDWDCAGAGPVGLDLGSLRFDAATAVGVEATAHVLAGWGLPAPDLAYWDIRAGISSPADLATWLPIMHDQGRTDLDAATMNARREAFLAAALRRLG